MSAVWPKAFRGPIGTLGGRHASDSPRVRAYPVHLAGPPVTLPPAPVVLNVRRCNNYNVNLERVDGGRGTDKGASERGRSVAGLLLPVAARSDGWSVAGPITRVRPQHGAEQKERSQDHGTDDSYDDPQ
jgi:hypothetical protein